MEQWEQLKVRLTELGNLQQAAGVLSWDQQTFMPPGGAQARSQQLATLSSVIHERTVAPALEDLLSGLEAQRDQLDDIQRASIRNLRRVVDQAARLPAALVSEMSAATSAALVAWQGARQADDFAAFQPALERVVGLKRQAAALLRTDEMGCDYDALLGQYDPGTTAAELRPMFARLGEALQPLVEEATAQPQPAPLDAEVPLDGLKALNRRVVEALGFEMGTGRLDESAHPFTLGLHPGDVRLTTHYHTTNLVGTLYGTIHETGHGLYEQGLPVRPGTLTDQAAGTGIHESQSRFWENVIGRSRPFSGWLAARIAEDIPSLSLTGDDLFRTLNRVSRSLIRIYSDELTYNLHIIVRFNLESALISGELAAADLEGAFADELERVVGVRPSGPAEGVLQDMHWAMGLFGYFPSYTIGNLYAASMRFALEEALPTMWDDVAAGNFTPIRDWLRANIHAHGSTDDAPVIFRRAVGDRDPVADLIAHLAQRRAAVRALG